MRRQLKRQLVGLIGSLIATFPAFPYGQLFYREMELTKLKAFKHQVYNFDKCFISLPTVTCMFRS